MKNIRINSISQSNYQGDVIFYFIDGDNEDDIFYRADYTSADDSEIPQYKQYDAIKAKFVLDCYDKFEKVDKDAETILKQTDVNFSSWTNAILKLQKIGNDLFGKADNFPQQLKLRLNKANKQIAALCNDDDVVEVNGTLRINFED